MYAGGKFWSTAHRNAYNAARGKILSGAYDPEGEFVLTLNGKESPAVTYLVQDFDVGYVWEFLAEQGIARSFIVEKHLEAYHVSSQYL